jgi:hypothetical protein
MVVKTTFGTINPRLWASLKLSSSTLMLISQTTPIPSSKCLKEMIIHTDKPTREASYRPKSNN